MSTAFSNGMLIGALVGVLGFAAAIEYTPISYHRQGRDAKVKCERALPRDQVCKIVAVPVDKE